MSADESAVPFWRNKRVSYVPGMSEGAMESCGVAEMVVWARTHGYALLETETEWLRNGAGELLALRVMSRMQARWDGGWGEIREALAEDGLLAVTDRKVSDVEDE